MQQFIKRFQQDISGVLSGWDRIRFRGTNRWLASLSGMQSFLKYRSILFKDFKDYAMGVTQAIRDATHAIAAQAERPVLYLESSAISKEDRARELAARNRVTEGLIGVFTCVEPCQTFTVAPNWKTKFLELRSKFGKCSHHYFYFLHPQWGFSHVRLQAWFPFTVHVCLNGREWLAQQMRRDGIGFQQRDNTFLAVGDLDRAQALLAAQLRTDWSHELETWVASLHPTHAQLFAGCPIPHPHYWSADESEWATDIMFRSSRALRRIYPHLVQHALQTFSSPDVFRFLGQKVASNGNVCSQFQGEVVTDLVKRPEGMRIKHRINHNSIKMYDKQGSVLRVETTINDARGLKSYRALEGQPESDKQWRRMRKGVVDLPRRAELSQASNTRYLEALSATGETTPVGALAARICRPVRQATRRSRALNPFSEKDAALLQAISRGEFAITGFRNADVRQQLHGNPPRDAVEHRRQSNAVTRMLVLLRAHRLIKRIPRTHRYQLTKTGRTTVVALVTVRHADTAKLTELAG